MAGTIVADIIQSDQSYASSINIASPMVVSNTINMTNGNISGNVNFDSGTLFVDSVGNRVSVGTSSPVSNSSFFVGNGFAKLSVEPPHESIASAGFTLGGYYNTVRYSSINTVLENGTPGGETSRITFYTAGSGTIREQVRIDGSGRVLMPYQPAFLAYTTNSSATYSAGTIIFDGVNFNTGGHYSSSTGRFTAPVAGRYLFSHNIQSRSATNNEVMFYINGSQVSDTTSMYSVGANGNASVMIFNLAANDYVTIYLYSGSVSGDYSNFSGYLIG